MKRIYCLAILCCMTGALCGCGGGNGGGRGGYDDSHLLNLKIQNAEWIAIQDGEGAWSAVCEAAPCNVSAARQMSDAAGRYGVAVVCSQGNHDSIIITYYTLAESNKYELNCPPANQGTIDVRFLYSAANRYGDVCIHSNGAAFSMRTIFMNSSSLSMPNMYTSGPASIIATERDAAGLARRMYVENYYNIVEGTSFMKYIDFRTANAFDVNGPMYSYSVTGIDPSETVQTDVNYSPGSGCSAVLAHSYSPDNGTTVTSNYYTLPSDRESDGGKYSLGVYVSRSDGGSLSERYISRTITPGNISVSAPGIQSFPTTSPEVISNSPVLLKSQWNAYPNSNLKYYTIYYTQNINNYPYYIGRNYSFTISKNRVGIDGTYSVSMLDFSSFASWKSRWNMTRGAGASLINWGIFTSINQPDQYLRVGRIGGITLP